ncbi:hypothetical protein [Novosphingobium sp. Gsoil 351]|uniref:hypothetical protein n=1 Tax=Novosphingobium sp. Gsoil 351 TaxID=2675225 RepID=UPI0018A83D82|nr:hypothetical protein [Novosphingobium sp. Gsoil 351]
MTRRKSSKIAKSVGAVGGKLAEVPGISPNPMTNLLLTDLVLRGGGQIMRHAVERTLLGTKYSKGKAKSIVKGRSMVQTMVGTALARIATRSVPGAIIVGGGMLAKTLYDRKQGKTAAKTEGERKVREQAAAGEKESDPIVT